MNIKGIIKEELNPKVIEFLVNETFNILLEMKY